MKEKMKKFGAWLLAAALAFAGAGAAQAETVTVTSQEELVAAVDAIPVNGGGEIILNGDEFTLYHKGANTAGKSITFIGQVDANGKPVTTWNYGGTAKAKGEGSSDYSFDGSGTISFKNVIFKDAIADDGSLNYCRGFVRAHGMAFENCTFKNMMGYFGDRDVLFRNCRFDVDSVYEYSMKAYSGKDFTFDGCTFMGNKKGYIQLFRESDLTRHAVTVRNCKFEAVAQTSKTAVYFYDYSTVQGSCWDIAFEGVNANVDNKIGAHATSGTWLWGDMQYASAGTAVVRDNGIVVWKDGKKVAPVVEDIKPVMPTASASVEVSAADGETEVIAEDKAVVEAVVAAGKDVAAATVTGIDAATAGVEASAKYVSVILTAAKVAKADSAKVVKSMTFEVKPCAVTSDGVSVIPNSQITAPITFRFPVDAAVAVGTKAEVTHNGVAMAGDFAVAGDDTAKYIEVASDTFSTFAYTLKEGGEEPTFSGNGSGTPDDPYQIATVAQLKEVNNAPDKNYVLVNDLVVTKDDLIETVFWGKYGAASVIDSLTGVMSGTFEGVRHKISFDDSIDSDPTLITTLDGTLKDIEIELSGGIVIACCTDVGPTLFDNVTASGWMTVDGNYGAYLVYAGSAVTFKNCTSEVLMSGVGGNTDYNAIFIGYAYSSQLLTFENCVNNGSIECGRASMFLGNMASYTINLAVKNCANNGIVRSTYVADDFKMNWYYSITGNNYTDFVVNGVSYGPTAERSAANQNVPSISEDTVVVNTGTASQGPLETGMEFYLNPNGTFLIIPAADGKIGGKDVAKYEVASGLYVGIPGGSSRFYAREFVTADGSDKYNTVMEDLAFVDAAFVDGGETTVVGENRIFTKDGVSYYVIGDNESLAGRPNQASNYYLSAYDANGKLLASVQLAGPTPIPGVAEIVETGVTYPSLKAAIDAVPTDGTETTIKMIADEAIKFEVTGVTIGNGQNIILDLNGKTIAGGTDHTSTSRLIQNNGTLTIKDSVEKTNGNFVGAIKSGASTTWQYGGDEVYTGSYASSLINNEGALTIAGGHFENVSQGSAAYVVDNSNNSSDASLTVTDGELVAAGECAVRLYVNSSARNNNAVISGGYFEAVYYAFNVHMGCENGKANAAIGGGTFEARSSDYNYSVRVGKYDGRETSNVSVMITGGLFNDGVIAAAGNRSITAAGGIYATNVAYAWGSNVNKLSDLCADGYEVVENTDAETKAAYPWTIGEVASDVAAVISVDGMTTNKFATLQAALDAAGANETVVLLADVTSAMNEAFTVAAGKLITLDLNGKVLSGRYDKTTGFAYLTNNGTLTLKDGSVKGTGKITSKTDPETGNLSGFYTVLNKGTFVMESGTIEENSEKVGGGNNLKWAFRNEASQNQTVSATIKGGLIVGNYNAISDYVYDDSSECTLNVEGGLIKSTGRFSVVTLQNATASKPKFHINISGGEFIVENGINTNPNGNAIFYCDDQSGKSADFTGCFKITGGKFNTFNTELMVDYDADAGTPIHDKKFMTAGLSKCVIPQESIADGYVCAANPDEATRATYPWVVQSKAQPEVEVKDESGTPEVKDAEGKEIPAEKQEAAGQKAAEVKTEVKQTLTEPEVAGFEGTGVAKAATETKTVGEEQVVEVKPAVVEALQKEVEKQEEKDQITKDSKVESRVEIVFNALEVKVDTAAEVVKTTETSVQYDVKPKVKTTVITTVGEQTEEKVVETVIPNSVIAGNPIKFRLAVDSTFGDFAKVLHTGAEDNFREEYLAEVFTANDASGKKFVELSSDHFSTFKLTSTSETPVCRVNDKNYTSLADAIAMGGATAEIVLLTDIELAADVTLGYNQTIDPGEFAISGAGTVKAADGYEVRIVNGKSVVYAKPTEVTVAGDQKIAVCIEPSVLKQLGGAAALADTAANGFQVWQNYVMGVDGAVTGNKLVPICKPNAENPGAAAVTITTPIVFGAAPAKTGIAVTYQLQKSATPKGGFSMVGEEQPTPVFAVDTSAEENATYWKIQAIFTPDVN